MSFTSEKVLEQTSAQTRKAVSVSARYIHAASRGRISPNAVTLTGLAAHLPIAWLIATSQFEIAALLLVVFGLFDTLDGELARLQHKTSNRGMLLDATADRIKEVMLYTGAVYYFAISLQPYFATWAIIACGASLTVSYVKAKGEMALQDKNLSPQEKNRVFQDGVFRFELRMAVLAIGLLFNVLGIAVIVIAAGSTLTAVQRFLTISKRL